MFSDNSLFFFQAFVENAFDLASCNNGNGLCRNQLNGVAIVFLAGGHIHIPIVLAAFEFCFKE